MKCGWCDNEPVAACRRCGRFYCPEHGGDPFIGPLCHEHVAQERVGISCLAVVMIAMGLGLLIFVGHQARHPEGWLAAGRHSEFLLIFGGLAMFLLLVGVSLLVRSQASPSRQNRSQPTAPPERGGRPGGQPPGDAIKPGNGGPPHR